MISMLGHYPARGISPLPDSHTTDIASILRKSPHSRPAVEFCEKSIQRRHYALQQMLRTPKANPACFLDD